MNDLQIPLREALESLDRPKVDRLIGEAIRGRPVVEAVESLVVPVLEQLGQEWSEGKIALSQIYMIGRICEEVVERVLPPMAPERKHQPPMAIAVLGDYHLLGKRIVLSVMRASGFELLDYGRLDAEELVARVIADRVEILLISVLMLPAALKVKEVRAALDAKGHHVRIAVGGAPFLFDEALWREAKADAMGRNAADAVSIVSRWLQERRA